MAVIKLPFCVLNLDRVDAVECIPNISEDYPERAFKIYVNGKSHLCYLSSEEKRDRFLDAVFKAMKDNCSLELDRECYIVDVKHNKIENFNEEELW